MKFSAKEIILATNAEVLKNETQDCDLFEISTDTRTVKNGDIYLPLKGEKFDGEKFIDKAVESGAGAYFTTCEKVEKNAKLVLKVKDTKIAYFSGKVDKNTGLGTGDPSRYTDTKTEKENNISNIIEILEKYRMKDQ